MAATFKSALSTRENNFDFLRVMLALGVMLSHCFPLTYGSNAREPLARLTGHETFGSIAVAGFFALSGFLIANSWMNSPGLLKFVYRRVSRIYPGLIAAILFTALVIGPFAIGGPFHLKAVLRSILVAIRYADEPILRPGLFMHNPLPGAGNGSMWTIWFELACYMMVAGLGLMGVLKRRSLLLGCFIVALGSLVAADLSAMGHFTPSVQHFFSGKLAYVRGPRLVTFFLAGSCFWAFAGTIPKSNLLAAACATGIIAAQFCGAAIAHMMLPILGVYLLFFVAFHEGLPLQHFGKRGDFSYGLYLYAWPVTQSLVSLTHAKLPPLVLFVLVFASTLPLAMGSWYFVERPFLRRKRQTQQSTVPIVSPAGKVESAIPEHLPPKVEGAMEAVAG